MHNVMEILEKTEIEYLKNFCSYTETEDFIRFTDNNLPDMYSHNLTLIRRNLPENRLRQIILDQAELKRKENSDFLNIEANCGIDEKTVAEVPIEGGEPEICYYMMISTDQYINLRGNSGCGLRKADNDQVLADGKIIDVAVNMEECGKDFAVRRCERKQAVYRKNDKLSFYVCYNGTNAVGMCEMFINGDTVKLEEFDVLENHQKKGYGTAIIKELLKTARDTGVKKAYVATYSKESAKEMYRKCGFVKVGEKRNYYFSL